MVANYYTTDGYMHQELICWHWACPRTVSHGIYFTVHHLFFFLFLLVITCLQNSTFRKVSLWNVLCVLCLFWYFSFQCCKYFYTVRELTLSGDSSGFRQRDKTPYLRCNSLIFPVRTELVQILCLTETEKSCSSFPYFCSFPVSTPP